MWNHSSRGWKAPPRPFEHTGRQHRCALNTGRWTTDGIRVQTRKKPMISAAGPYGLVPSAMDSGLSGVEAACEKLTRSILKLERHGWADCR